MSELLERARREKEYLVALRWLADGRGEEMKC